MALVGKDKFSRPAKLLILVIVQVVELTNEHKLSADSKVLECFSVFAQEMTALPSVVFLR